MASRHQNQLNLPPAQLANCSQQAAPRTKDSQASEQAAARTNHSDADPLRTFCSEEQADAEAAFLIDRALYDARITSKELAGHLSLTESLINRWRSPNYRECPSFRQIVRFPLWFHWKLFKLMAKRYGFAKFAAAESIDAAATFAMVASE